MLAQALGHRTISQAFTSIWSSQSLLFRVRTHSAFSQMPYGAWDMVYKGRQGGWTERRGEKTQERGDNTDLWPVLKGQVDQEELIAKEGGHRER